MEILKLRSLNKGAEWLTCYSINPLTAFIIFSSRTLKSLLQEVCSTVVRVYAGAMSPFLYRFNRLWRFDADSFKDTGINLRLITQASKGFRDNHRNL